MQKRFEVCPAAELPPGEREIVDLNGVSIGVFNVDGDYYALKNDCPHQRAPLCMGKVTGTTSAARSGDVNWENDGHILRCPWHGWEFDIQTGRSVFNPHEVRARSYDAVVESAEDGGQVDGDDAARGNDEHEDGERGTDERGDDAENAPATGGCDCGAVGAEPPVDTYEVAVEDEVVVVYL